MLISPEISTPRTVARVSRAKLGFLQGPRRQMMLEDNVNDGHWARQRLREVANMPAACRQLESRF